MLELYELRVFLAAAETENFSEAGRRLQLSQPAVSMQIQSLERRLGMELFHRNGRRIALSEAGEALVPLARDLLNMAIRIEEAIASLQGKVVGHLRIACTTTPGRYILPRLIARFRERYPDVQVTCHVVTRPIGLQMLREATVHATITSQRMQCKDVEFRHFFSDDVLLIIPPDHPWASREYIEPEELLGQNFILREPGSGTRQVVEAGLVEVGISIDQLRTVMTLGSSESIRMAVGEGMGAAFVSALAARECINAGRIATVKVRGLELKQEIFIGRNVGRAAPAVLTAFWDFVFAPENHSLLRVTDAERERAV